MEEVTNEEFEKAVEEVLKNPKYESLLKVDQEEKYSTSTKKDKPSYNPSPMTGKYLLYGILVIGIIGVIVGCISLVSKIKTRRKNPRPKEILGEKITSKDTPELMWDKAVALEAQKENREAIRYYFIAILFQLQERRIIQWSDALTNQEIYGLLVRIQFKGCREFMELIKAFNKSWYGHQPEEDLGGSSVRNSIEFLWNEVRRNDK